MALPIRLLIWLLIFIFGYGINTSVFGKHVDLKTYYKPAAIVISAPVSSQTNTTTTAKTTTKAPATTAKTTAKPSNTTTKATTKSPTTKSSNATTKPTTKASNSTTKATTRAPTTKSSNTTLKTTRGTTKGTTKRASNATTRAPRRTTAIPTTNLSGTSLDIDPRIGMRFGDYYYYDYGYYYYGGSNYNNYYNYYDYGSGGNSYYNYYYYDYGNGGYSYYNYYDYGNNNYNYYNYYDYGNNNYYNYGSGGYGYYNYYYYDYGNNNYNYYDYGYSGYNNYYSYDYGSDPSGYDYYNYDSGTNTGSYYYYSYGSPSYYYYYYDYGKKRKKRDTSLSACGCYLSAQCTNTGNTDGTGLIDFRSSIFTCPSGLTYCCPMSAIPQISCGSRITNYVTKPLQNGDAKYGDYPWMAFLQTSANDFIGGGVLIDTQHVLTVAHKVVAYKNSTSGIKVRLGDWDTSATYEQFPYRDYNVSKVWIHESFNPANLQNDIALIRLSSTAETYPTVGVVPVCMPSSGQSFEGQRCWVCGWGKDEFGVNGRYQNILRATDIPIISSSSCQTALQKTRLGSAFVLDKTSFICAGGELYKDACTGDGGSGLVCEDTPGKWVLAGLVAWGIGCSGQNIPAAYVNIANYLPWIQAKQAIK